MVSESAFLFRHDPRARRRLYDGNGRDGYENLTHEAAIFGNACARFTQRIRKLVKRLEKIGSWGMLDLFIMKDFFFELPTVTYVVAPRHFATIAAAWPAAECIRMDSSFCKLSMVSRDQYAVVYATGMDAAVSQDMESRIRRVSHALNTLELAYAPPTAPTRSTFCKDRDAIEPTSRTTPLHSSAILVHSSNWPKATMRSRKVIPPHLNSMRTSSGAKA